jgi:hypothetical protein
VGLRAYRLIKSHRLQRQDFQIFADIVLSTAIIQRK